MHDDSRPASELREALDAVGAGSIREALGTVNGTPAADDAEPDGVFWPDSPAPRQWPRRLGRALARPNWLLIVTVVVAILTYLILVKPG